MNDIRLAGAAVPSTRRVGEPSFASAAFWWANKKNPFVKPLFDLERIHKAMPSPSAKASPTQAKSLFKRENS